MSRSAAQDEAVAAAARKLEADICDLAIMAEISMGIATDALGIVNHKPSEKEMEQVVFLTTEVFRRMARLRRDYYAALGGEEAAE